jgi:citronellol/citronellal dehydrogenase
MNSRNPGPQETTPRMDVRDDEAVDAAHLILCRDARECSGHFFIDQDVLRAEGRRDFDRYQVVPGKPLLKDLFLD